MTGTSRAGFRLFAQSSPRPYHVITVVLQCAASSARTVPPRRNGLLLPPSHHIVSRHFKGRGRVLPVFPSHHSTGGINVGWWEGDRWINHLPPGQDRFRLDLGFSFLFFLNTLTITIVWTSLIKPFSTRSTDYRTSAGMVKNYVLFIFSIILTLLSIVSNKNVNFKIHNVGPHVT